MKGFITNTNAFNLNEYIISQETLINIMLDHKGESNAIKGDDILRKIFLEFDTLDDFLVYYLRSKLRSGLAGLKSTHKFFVVTSKGMSYVPTNREELVPYIDNCERKIAGLQGNIINSKKFVANRKWLGFEGSKVKRLNDK